MDSITKAQEATSADKKLVGFDYQFLYFVYRALDLKPGQKIGYEVKDDVHIEAEDHSEVLIQLKHSLQVNKDSSIINMNEKDSDLWKTLYNWNKSINELEKEEREEYINKHEFLLVTNKNNKNNKFFTNTDKVKKGILSVSEYKRYIRSIKEDIRGIKDESEKLKKYIDSVINQDDEILVMFISRLSFNMGFDELVNIIKNQIRTSHVDERKVDEIFERCLGNLSIWKYEKIKANSKVYISFEEIDKKIRRFFEYGRSTKLPRIINTDIELTNDLKSQPFIRELIEIEDISYDDLDEILDYTSAKMRIKNLLDYWLEESFITETESELYLEECFKVWKNYHKSSHRITKKRRDKDGGLSNDLESIDKENALECLDGIRKLTMRLEDEELSISESNGTFYMLSDQAKLGWLLKWESRYKHDRK